MSLHRTLTAAVFGLVAVAGLAGAASAADVALYPSGPPNGVGYLRFANLTARPVTVSSAAAKITLPANDEQRVRRYDPVNPAMELTGTIQDGAKTAPIQVKVAPNEFVTIVVTATADGGIATKMFRETPSDFNASKASLALYNADAACADARLLAGDKDAVVASGIAPGASARRLVNPVKVALKASCDPSGAKAVPVDLGPLAAGDRYSVFVYNQPGSDPHAFGLRDETASFRP